MPSVNLKWQKLGAADINGPKNRLFFRTQTLDLLTQLTSSICLKYIYQIVSSFSDMKSLGPTSISSQGNTLKHLVLSKNKLSEVPTRALKHLTELEHLNLNENQIQVLRNEAFTGLSKVNRTKLIHKGRSDWKWFQLAFKHFVKIQFVGHSFEFISQSHQHDWATCIWWHQKVISHFHHITLSFFKTLFSNILSSPLFILDIIFHSFAGYGWSWGVWDYFIIPILFLSSFCSEYHARINHSPLLLFSL